MTPMFSARSALNAYRSVGVQSIVDSASPHQLIVMLFAGARAAIASARVQMQKGDVTAKCQSISKAMAIVDDGLKAILDVKVGGDLARNLYDLYGYMSTRLVQANANNDRAALDEVDALLQQIGSAWESLSAKGPAPQISEPTQRAANGYGAV